MSRRILFLEVLPTISGGQRALLDLIPGLADCELHALLPASGPFEQSLADLGVTCHFCDMPQFTLVNKGMGDSVRMLASLPRLAVQTARLARRLDIELIYANNGRAFVWGTPGAMLAGRPILWHMHNVLGDAKSERLIRGMAHVDAVKRIVSVSDNANRPFAHLDKAAVIPLGVDTLRFRPDHTAREQIRAELRVGADTFCVGCIGDLIALKGQDTIVRAAARLPDVAFLLIGESREGSSESHEYAVRLRRTAGPNVRLLGQREDIPQILNALDLLIIASQTETGPRVLLEAMASGIPVLSTPVGRAAELVRPGITGELLAIRDAAALVHKIRTLREQPLRCKEVGARARQVALEELSMGTFHRRMRQEIELALS